MYTLCNLILQPIKLQELFDNPLVSYYYKPNNKNQYDWY